MPTAPLDLSMFAMFCQYVFRPTLLIAAILFVTFYFANWGPVPFPHLLIGVIPACLIAVLVFRRSLLAADRAGTPSPRGVRGSTGAICPHQRRIDARTAREPA